MVVYHKQIASYKVFHNLGTDAENNYAVTIQIFMTDNITAYIKFVTEGKPIPSNVKIGNVYRTYSPIARYMNIMDTLRNEKPCYFHFNEGTKLANLGTHIEPVGEGEDE